MQKMALINPIHPVLINGMHLRGLNFIVSKQRRFETVAHLLIVSNRVKID